MSDLLKIKAEDVDSVVLKRIISEVQEEREYHAMGYNRVHNRHNRSGPYNRVHNRHNRGR